MLLPILELESVLLMLKLVLASLKSSLLSSEGTTLLLITGLVALLILGAYFVFRFVDGGTLEALGTDFGVILFKSSDKDGYLTELEDVGLDLGGSFDIFRAPELTAARDLGEGEGVTRNPASRSG